METNVLSFVPPPEKPPSQVRIPVDVFFDGKRGCKMIEVHFGPYTVGSTFSGWEEFAELFLRCLSYPDDWLTQEWHVIGVPPKDEGIRFAVRRDPVIWSKAIRMEIPNAPQVLNYVVVAQLVGLLAIALAFPDDQLTHNRTRVGELVLLAPGVDGGAAQVKEIELPTKGTPPTA